MKAIKLATLALTLAAGITTAQAQTAAELLKKRGDAMGNDAWKNVKTMKIVMTVSQQGMEMPMTITSIVDKAMRMDISIMGTENYYIISGTQGWKYFPIQGATKVDTISKEEMAGLKDLMDIKARQTKDYMADGTKADVTGKDTIDGSMCYKVKLSSKEGEETTLFIDSKTFYVVRSESKITTDNGEKEATVVYSNYQKTSEGIVMPMKIVSDGNPVEFKSIEFNKPVDEKIFAPSKS